MQSVAIKEQLPVARTAPPRLPLFPEKVDLMDECFAPLMRIIAPPLLVARLFYLWGGNTTVPLINSLIYCAGNSTESACSPLEQVSNKKHIIATTKNKKRTLHEYGFYWFIKYIKRNK